MTTAMPLAAPAPGARLVTEDGRSLPFRGGSLEVRARAGLARVVLVQRFVNPHADPLRVHLHVPLPADAAVSGFAFEVAGERIAGRVAPRAEAREQFEQALVEGRSAALLEQDRSSLFRQEVGNVPAGAAVSCEVVLDQLLHWEAPGWAWRFPTVVAPRFLGGPGQTPDAESVTVDVVDGGTRPRMHLDLRIEDACTGPATSPSHRVRVDGGEVSLIDEEGVALDRDVVVRWPVAAPEPGVQLDVGRAAAGEAAAHTAALLTLVPPEGSPEPVARDLIVLLDTSGSMHGAPLAQARAVTLALIDTLGPQDRLQLVEFSNAVRSWKEAPVSMTASARRGAAAWVRALKAGGGTQMRDGILAALERLRGEALRQVVLVTDGLIGFEAQIVSAVADGLPRGCRVHTVGVGRSTNRSLLRPVARAGAGVEVIIDLDEDPGEAAATLVAATAAPVVVDVRIEGAALHTVAPAALPELYAGRPARLALRVDAAGGPITVSGTTVDGAWSHTLTLPAVEAGTGSAAVVALEARERAEDLEVRAACGEDVDAELERLGVAWQISTRMTSWVAVSAEATVDPGDPTRRVVVPQALPSGLSAEGLGLRPAAPPQPQMTRSALASPAAPTSGAVPPDAYEEAAPARRRPKKTRRGGRLEAFMKRMVGRSAPEGPSEGPVMDRHDARMMRHRGQLTVEIYVEDEGIRWIRPTSVRLVYADGRVEEVQTVGSLCTSDGVWEDRDQVVRVVVPDPRPDDRPVRVEIDQPDDRILVMEL